MTIRPRLAHGLLAAVVATATLGAAVHANAQTIRSEAGPIGVERLAKLDNPWGVASLPDGRLLVTEKPGRLRVFADGKLSEPVKGVPAVASEGQGGLLGLAVDPQFQSNRYVYLYFTEAADPQPADAKHERDPRLGPNQKLQDTVLKGGAVARGRLDGDTLSDVTVIWRQVPKTIGRGHFGGRLVFGRDGTLFITSGERQRFEPAQDLNSNLGKIVRINSDGSIPKDNPFVGRDGVRPDIWAVGVRNPLGATLHPGTGQLWINDMGPKGGDEVVMIEAGKNYGWPLVAEGTHYNDTPIPGHDTRPEMTAPFHAFEGTVAPSGFAFYRGDRFKGWNEAALIGGLAAQAIVRLTIFGKVTGEERIAAGSRVRDVVQTPDGALLVLTDGEGGELLRLSPGDATIGKGAR